MAQAAEIESSKFDTGQPVLYAARTTRVTPPAHFERSHVEIQAAICVMKITYMILSGDDELIE